jgi:3-hydroxyisobutyrate dehydrogenase-like beta-hydroxyacid dehydrogenase
MNQKVTVIGTGRMGSALATTLFNKGFATTVWNRTAAKTEPLARLGLHVAQSVQDAVNESDVVIVNINDYKSTLQLLQHPDVESALHGKALVQLTSGTPHEAREMESWAKQRGIGYLDGVIMSAPMGIGTPACTVLCSGPEGLFNRVKPVLMAFGDNPRLVGDEIGQASALDVAVLAAFVMSAMFGFLQGYIVCEAENVPLEKYLHSIKSKMPTLEMIVSRVYGKIREENYRGDQSTLEAWSAGPKELIDWCRDRGVDYSITDAQLSVFDKAIKSGKGEADFAYLYEVLRKGEG